LQALRTENTYFGGKINIANNESYSYNYTDKWDKATETDMSIPMGAGGMVSTPSDLTQFIEALFGGKLISSFIGTNENNQDKYGMGLFKYRFMIK
jgi:CubicO group peptidase (beta-lactamase class C family)